MVHVINTKGNQADVDITQINSVITSKQEPITRSVFTVTAFSQTDRILVWIYREFRPPQEP